VQLAGLFLAAQVLVPGIDYAGEPVPLLERKTLEWLDEGFSKIHKDATPLPKVLERLLTSQADDFSLSTPENATTPYAGRFSEAELEAFTKSYESYRHEEEQTAGSPCRANGPQALGADLRLRAMHRAADIRR
jgi:hypothetical protein